MSEKDEFLSPRARYQGEFTPQNLAFDSNLQEFAQQVAYICSLETAGKLTPHTTPIPAFGSSTRSWSARITAWGSESRRPDAGSGV